MIYGPMPVTVTNAETRTVPNWFSTTQVYIPSSSLTTPAIHSIYTPVHQLSPASVHSFVLLDYTCNTHSTHLYTSYHLQVYIPSSSLTTPVVHTVHTLTTPAVHSIHLYTCYHLQVYMPSSSLTTPVIHTVHTCTPAITCKCTFLRPP